jgi:hypothetical protein
MLEKSNSLDLFKFKEKERVRKQIYYKNNAELIKEKVAKHNKLNAEKRRLVVKKSWIKCTYGIVYEDYLSMHREQDYKCKICKRREFKKGLVVDLYYALIAIHSYMC